MEYLSLGKIIDTFGLDGTVKIYSTTDFSKERYSSGAVLYLFKPEDDFMMQVHPVKHRKHKDYDFVKFEEINSIEEALTKKNYYVYIPKEDASLPSDYYHYYELENCDVYDQNNSLIGKVINVEEFPSTTVIRIKQTNGKTFMIPFKDDFVKKVDVTNKRIDIEVVEGML
jgi:16S rRNA processing protein RimM